MLKHSVLCCVFCAFYRSSAECSLLLEIFRLRCCLNICTSQASNQHHGQKHLKERCHQTSIFCFPNQPLCNPKLIVLLPEAHSAEASIAAMDAMLVVQVLEAMNESIAINLKWTKIRTMLAHHGLCWNSKEKVEMLEVELRYHHMMSMPRAAPSSA